MSKRCLTMILLVLLTTSSAYGGEVIRVPQGWQAPTEGYFMDRPAAEEVGIALQERRLKMWTFEAAHQDLRAELIPKVETLERQLKDITDRLNNERTVWKKEVVRSKTSNILWIIAAGAAGYAVRR
ncbi:hypothetical protein AGMMS49957_10460 [Synergistales bacterium]|nr:hypothetical protein AGMMS49957_10460 [Synergistales bacterium]